MTLAFDLPACPPSVVQRLDPRWKLAGVLPATLAIALLRSEGPAMAALAGALLLVVLARLPWRWYLRRMGTAVVFFVALLIWLPFVRAPEDAPLDLGIVTLSLPGLVRLLVLSAKLAAMISLMLVLLATAPLQDTFKAAHALKIPGLLIHLVLLTYRYVFLLVEEFARLRIALRVRGFRNRVNPHSYRTIGQVAGTLLVRSHERSERVAQAMRCRGFAGEFHTLTDFRTRALDVLAFLVIAAYAVGLLVWDWAVFV
ncbi:MAG: cobalt ECF transporter T component CbiQ [Gemmataceae bacterium]|nr:cobalt ECF transporter T component CbiQ [Gemmataceae bacterium]